MDSLVQTLTTGPELLTVRPRNHGRTARRDRPASRLALLASVSLDVDDERKHDAAMSHTPHRGRWETWTTHDSRGRRESRLGTFAGHRRKVIVTPYGTSCNQEVIIVVVESVLSKSRHVPFSPTTCARVIASKLYKLRKSSRLLTIPMARHIVNLQHRYVGHMPPLCLRGVTFSLLGTGYP